MLDIFNGLCHGCQTRGPNATFEDIIAACNDVL